MTIFASERARREGRKEGRREGWKEGRKRTQTAKPRAVLKNIESIKPTEIQSKP
jgi:flagellar biosynthesis/type III secretory pathway protein FliH